MKTTSLNFKFTHVYKKKNIPKGVFLLKIRPSEYSLKLYIRLENNFYNKINFIFRTEKG